MIYSNVYKRLIEWIEPLIEESKVNDYLNVNVYTEIMPSNETEGIVIQRVSTNPEIETYITGDSLLQFKFTIRSVQKIVIGDETEKINLSQFLDNISHTLLDYFNNGNKPVLDIGYKAKNIEILNTSSLQSFDINTLIYGIDINFNYEIKRSLKNEQH